MFVIDKNINVLTGWSSPNSLLDLLLICSLILALEADNLDMACSILFSVAFIRMSMVIQSSLGWERSRTSITDEELQVKNKLVLAVHVAQQNATWKYSFL